MNEKLKLSKAIFIIFLSTLLVSGSNFLIFTMVRIHHKNRVTCPKYNIKAIAQNQNEITLDANYLAELMGLSSNNPTNLFAFDEKRAVNRLLLSPIIKEAEVKKIKPNCIFVDYKVRKPIAYLYDLENVAIDEEGYIFPVNPFYPPLDLCKFYINLEEFKGYRKIDSPRVIDAIDIYKKLKTNGFCDLVRIKVLDTSRLELQSYGKKEILLFIEEEVKVNKNQKDTTLIFPTILRLAMNNYLEQIGNYISLRSKILKDYENQMKNLDFVTDVVKFKPKTIDLRLSKLAFIDQ